MSRNNLTDFYFLYKIKKIASSGIYQQQKKTTEANQI